jgi:CBS domain containing-hemolysin-like protein
MSDERSETRSAAEHEPGRESWLERLFGLFGTKPRESMRDDLEEVLAAATAAPDLSPRERLMLKNVLNIHNVRVSDVMVPRADTVSVAAESPLALVLHIFRTAGHSRLPVYGESLDEPLGMVHIRDFLAHITAGADEGSPGENGAPGRLSFGTVDLDATLASAGILRPVLFVPRSMPAIDLLARMQASRTHMALVIDEYGGTDGVVSIEDLLETVVGDIEDEHDETEHMIVTEEGGALVVDARASLEEVSEALGFDLAESEESDDVDTLGGLIATSVGRVPVRGELIAGPGGLEFEVLDADPRRLKRVRIRRRPADRDGAGADAGPAQAALRGEGRAEGRG